MSGMEKFVVYLLIVIILLLVYWVREMHRKDEARRRHITNLNCILERLDRELSRRGVDSNWVADEDYYWIWLDVTDKDAGDRE